MSKKSISRTQLKLVISGFIAGLLWLSLMRFITFDSSGTHYHANFGVVNNGAFEKFESFVYYEEVEACSADHAQNAKARVHMHQPDNDVVHVHDEAATWGHFFESLGLSLSNKHVETESGFLIDDNEHDLTFVLNGQKVGTIENRVIQDEDRLLIAYDDASVDATKYFSHVENDATEHNQTNDPSTCSGKDNSLWQRLKESILF